jgi:hypothetical protein
VNVSANNSFNGKKKILRAVCQEIIPAALNSPDSPLSPGCVQFKYSNVGNDDINTDVFIEIRAYKSKDRLKNREDRAESIRRVLSGMFRHYTFSVWVDLAYAGYSSDVKDSKIDCDMSMEAAISRLRNNIKLKL